MSQSRAGRMYHSILGLWIVSMVLLIGSAALNFDSGVATALVMASGATGILSALYVYYLAEKRGREERVNPLLLTVTGLLVAVFFYVVVSVLVM
ncbi:hypothetical protein GC425_07235 [Corynebacterium sp. zg254]|uniref:Uncharacterized protein n=1 Tax=Corynebacterium zhongnanshanii TaxID=2768834 RepID=A0ABQ6VE39_9CORY|nr:MULTISPECIES: hypothetical protein [Corynebacterium]KAB3521008.1 hypothetical protein F8377_07255 [Corynebacterium zhongnanshanii]MCR5914649.1 hypothetical protein [Corynebacterium sp. zg254]